MTKLRWLVAALCILAIDVDAAHACRYNVREVGFIDVGIEPYRLFVYVPGAAASNAVDTLRDELDVAFADTNIRSEIVPVGADANHPAARLLSLHGIDGSSDVVLVSPDGPSRPLPVPPGAPSLATAISSALDTVLHSPTQRQILTKAAESYAVVLLLEGPQPDRNAAARAAVSTAIAEINGHLEYLPKPIAKGPEMVVLDQASLAREEALLWALGLKPRDVNEPQAAIFYGRGRWIGPLFKGETLVPENLAQVLAVIGADCECGLDHRWLQGTMLPARWDAELQQKVTTSLGFDPESPMIRMEMASIVRRGMGGLESDVMPFGYREMEVGVDAPDLDMSPEHAASVNEPPTTASRPVAAPAQVEMERRRSGAGILALSLGGMVVLVAVASVVVLLKAKRV